MKNCVLIVQLEIPQITYNLFSPSAQIGQLFGIFKKKSSYHMSIVHGCRESNSKVPFVWDSKEMTWPNYSSKKNCWRINERSQRLLFQAEFLNPPQIRRKLSSRRGHKSTRSCKRTLSSWFWQALWCWKPTSWCYCRI